MIDETCHTVRSFMYALVFVQIQYFEASGL